MSEDREYLPTSENLYSTEQKNPSEEFRKNWDLITWGDDYLKQYPDDWKFEKGSLTIDSEDEDERDTS